MSFILLDTATQTQSSSPEVSTIFLIVGLVIGIGMIGFGVYSIFINKRNDNYDDEHERDLYASRKAETNNGHDYEDNYDDNYEQEETYSPIVEEYTKKPFEENEVSHSVKTNAYKVRDSIRCAHDIEDSILKEKGYLAMLCDGINGDEDTPAYISKRIMDDFYSKSRTGASIQDFFENTIDKLDAEMVKFSNTTKSGTSMLACVMIEKELYIIGVGSARLYHIRGESMRKLTSEHRYHLELDAKVKSGEIDAMDAQNNPRRDELVSYIGVGGVNYIDMNDVPIMLNEGDILLYCSDGLYNILSDDEIYDAVHNYDGEFKNCAKVLTTAAMESANSNKDNDISVLMIKIGK